LKNINTLKYLTVVLISLALSASFSGCKKEVERISDDPGLLENEVEFDMLSASDIDGSYYTTGIVRNNSDKLYSFHVDLLYYGRNNRLIDDTQQLVILDLYPDMEKAFFYITPEDYSRAARIEARVSNIIKAEDCSITPNLVFDNLSVYHHEYGTDVRGEVTNLDGMQYSIIILAAVYDGHGNPVKANIHGIDNIYPGETRVFSAAVLGEETNATDGRVYLESITQVTDAKEKPNIEFSDAVISYDSGIDRSSVMFDITNNDNRGYRDIELLFGIYDQGKLLNVIQAYVMSIGPKESVPFNQALIEGDWSGKELRISINSLAEDT